MNSGEALATIPSGLREPLLAEYKSILESYAENRWTPAELYGGRFCEIVYCIIDGHAKGVYLAAPKKPPDFAGACRALEKNTHVPRSFQILIPRLLPALFEVRNNRNVGHVGGDVDPNHMDATFVVSSCNWTMAELVRVFHGLTPAEAQVLVDNLVERTLPIIWEGENVRRVLDATMPVKSQAIILLATSSGKVSTSDLLDWIGYQNRSYFFKLLRSMHGERLIELSKDERLAEILPPGRNEAAQIFKENVP